MDASDFAETWKAIPETINGLRQDAGLAPL